MKPLHPTRLNLLLVISLILTPLLITSCGGSRYSCDSCNNAGTNNPDETGAADLATVLPLNLIEAAGVIVGDATQTRVFDNYQAINYRIGTITDARQTTYNKDDTLANIAGVNAQYWDDQIETLAWKATNSDLSDTSQRQYYHLENDVWKLVATATNNHELRRYDKKVYDFWLGATVKWEIYEARERTNPSGVNYLTIAGRSMDDILLQTAFDPPILDNPVALQGVQLWGKGISFTNTANSEAKIYVVYKQYRPITVTGDDDATVLTGVTANDKGFYAFVPAQGDNNATAFNFVPLDATTDPDTFRSEFSGETSKPRIEINSNLFISFNLAGSEGSGGQGVFLWSSKTTPFPDGFADYYEVTATNGSYIRIDITMAKKATYNLETYQNPLIAFIESSESDSVNNGALLGWYYVPSGTLEEDLPKPHYAFNGTATSDLETAFSNWRRLQYCDDNAHNDDPGRASLCARVVR